MLSNRVTFFAQKGELGTLAIRFNDTFSKHIIEEELINLKEETVEQIIDILPNHDKYLVEYHSKFNGIDNVEVWFTLVEENNSAKD